MTAAPPRIGSLFSGYGGLEQGVQSVLGGSVAWHSEIDPGACKILAHRYPDVPNLGDVTAIDWSLVPPVDVLTGGYPCQPFSVAGQRQGVDDARHLWPHFAEAIGQLRPSLVVLENVRGHLTLGFDEVVRDLNWLGYDCRWIVIRASDIGAPHGRARIFALGVRRESCVCGRPDRRRGVHRDQGDLGVLCDSPEDRHDRQGGLLPESSRGDLRREDDALSAEGCESASSARVAAERAGCRILPAIGSSTSDHQDGDCGSGARVAGHDRLGSSPREWASDLVGGNEAARLGSALAGDGAEPGWAGARTADAPRGAAFGGLPLGRVVGAGRGSLRPGGVHGEVPDVWADDRGTHLPAGCADDCVFVVTWPAADTGRLRGQPRGIPAPGQATGGRALGVAPGRDGARAADTDGAGLEGAQPAPGRLVPDWGAAANAARYGRHEGRAEPARVVGGSDAALGGDAVADADRGQRAGRQQDTQRGTRRRVPAAGTGGGDLDWGPFGPAIDRWERALGRVAPSPTELSAKGAPRLSPAFVEWMMGLPAGWVTDVPGLTRNEQLKALGNGVVPQQAAAVLRLLLPDVMAGAA